jgi:hypothetical protein
MKWLMSGVGTFGTADIANECPIIEQNRSSHRAADFHRRQDLLAGRRARPALVGAIETTWIIAPRSFPILSEFLAAQKLSKSTSI